MNDGWRVKFQKKLSWNCVPAVLKLLWSHCEIFGFPAITEVRVVLKHLAILIENEYKEIKGMTSHCTTDFCRGIYIYLDWYQWVNSLTLIYMWFLTGVQPHGCVVKFGEVSAVRKMSYGNCEQLCLPGPGQFRWKNLCQCSTGFQMNSTTGKCQSM